MHLPSSIPLKVRGEAYLAAFPDLSHHMGPGNEDYSRNTQPLKTYGQPTSTLYLIDNDKLLSFTLCNGLTGMALLYFSVTAMFFPTLPSTVTIQAIINYIG